MLKGQLSRVPWPGNLWMPFTFRPAHQALQQSHKHSHSERISPISHGSEIDIQETPTLMQQICIYAMDTHLAIVLQVASFASTPAYLYLTLWYAPSVVPFLWLLRYSFARF